NATNLLDECKDDIDVFMFGHTHFPTISAYDGYVMISAGPTLALGNSAINKRRSFEANFQAVRIQDRNTVEVETFYWMGGKFSTFGSKPLSFRRGLAAGSARGVGRWA